MEEEEEEEEEQHAVALRQPDASSQPMRPGGGGVQFQQKLMALQYKTCIELVLTTWRFNTSHRLLRGDLILSKCDLSVRTEIVRDTYTSRRIQTSSSTFKSQNSNELSNELI